ncbi:PKD domain-containing protein [Kitasatospora sp. NRRL B-11411]|uniref:PKD domain-containing protein n=1 Tax=Kitasatospora sp. NRRL B-11411 TaxID=1463822 RepID=UPI0004C343F5|nr:PKD domain-containing protein [Kitasatospora sp. NRRL B-11411]
MRLRQSAALTVAAATSVLAFPALPASAATAGNTLYVNRASVSCTDAGTGTEANPYCTISAAAAVVRPGQTVKVAAGSGTYPETVTIDRSGTPEQPITFLGMVPGEQGIPPIVYPGGSAEGITLAGVHDVVVRGFSVRHRDAGAVPVVSVRDSSRVTLDQNRFFAGTGGPSVRISGDSGDLTVARNRFTTTGGLQIGAGAHDVLVSANQFDRTSTAAVTAADAPRTAVTNNTIVSPCGEAVRIDGASPGAVIENNLVKADGEGAVAPACGTGPDSRGEAEIAVSAGSVSGSKVDYNLLHPWSGGSAYAWAGTKYPTAAEFTAAQPGQAGHDVHAVFSFTSPGSGELRLPASVTADALAWIDSTDPDAPGVGTDLLGVKPTDDPDVPNTGGVRDRGAYELSGQAPAGLLLTALPPMLQGPAPFTVTAQASAWSRWGFAQANYHFVFGDGTSVDSATPTVQHTYTTPGSYTASVTATDTQGAASTSQPQQVEVKPAGDLAVDVAATPDDVLGVSVVTKISSPYLLDAGYLVNYGDNESDFPMLSQQAVYHRYQAPGTYQITVTAGDQGQRNTVVRKTVKIASSGYDASIAEGERVQLFAFDKDGYPPVGSGANYTLGRWAPFTPVRTTGLPTPSGTVSAAVIAEDQHLRLFSLARDGRVLYADRNLGPDDGYLKRGAWDQWYEVTAANSAGPLPGITQLSATAIGNTIHLVAVAKGRVYETSVDRSSWKWSPWGDITGTLGYPGDVTSAAAASIGNVMHVAMLSSDGRIRVGDGDYGRGRWSGGELTAAVGRLPGTTTQVAAAATPGSKFHVVALADGKVYEAGGDYAAGRWTNWGNITAETGLPALTRVAAAGTGNSLRVFGLTAGNQIMNADGNYTLGRWTRADRVDGPYAAGPTDPNSRSLVVDLSVAGR